MKIFTATALSFLFLLSTASAQPVQAPTQTPQAVATNGTTPAAKPADSAAPAAAANVTPDYRITPGDKLAVQVYKDPQLSQQLQVRPDGKITLPLVGDIVAAGRTSLELRDTLNESLKEYIANPVVTVIVVETTPQVVYVMGEVQHPGTIPLMNGRMNIVQALAMAGGFTEFANKKDIKVSRKGPAGMETLKFNYKESIKRSLEPLQLQAGDTVIVK